MKTIWRFIKKFMFGFVALYAFNFIGSFFDIALASNMISYFLIGIFGPSGLLFVYIGNLIYTAFLM